jgi:hypothetical protein
MRRIWFSVVNSEIVEAGFPVAWQNIENDGIQNQAMLVVSFKEIWNRSQVSIKQKFTSLILLFLWFFLSISFDDNRYQNVVLGFIQAQFSISFANVTAEAWTLSAILQSDHDKQRTFRSHYRTIFDKGHKY